ncbi:hypothetical protein Goarm_011155, partial [Gossypium armourianum]|nr:hypothetical protein [Gossypium armourianum]
ASNSDALTRFYNEKSNVEIVKFEFRFVEVASSPYVDQATIDQRLRDKYSPIFLTSLSAIRSHGKPASDKIRAVHAVSHRVVPGGPNQLHN